QHTHLCLQRLTDRADRTRLGHGRVVCRAPPNRSLADHVRRRRGFGRHRRFYETAAASATDLSAFAAGVAGLVGGPLVSGALLMRRTPPLAGDFPLLLGGHRRESAAFLALSIVHRQVLCKFTHIAFSPRLAGLYRRAAESKAVPLLWQN